MKKFPKLHRQNLIAIFLFYFLLFLYPSIALLWRRTYPIFSSEVGILFLLIIAMATLLAYIVLNVRSTIGLILTALLITVTFLVQFDLFLEGIVVCTIVSLIIAWRLKANFYLYSLPILSALIIGAWFDSVGDIRKAQAVMVAENVESRLPPIVHILLDGFIGLDGLPSSQNSSIFREESLRFFRDFGFQVFPRAYSRYTATVDSLYSAFNFEAFSESRYSMEVLSRREHVMETNSQFDSLETLGYRFNIYQSGHIDFCQSNPDNLDRCWEYDQPNIHSLQEIESALVRARMLARILLTQSSLISGILSSNHWSTKQAIAVHDPRVFSEMKNDVLSKPVGRLFFAHVLLPHAPFVFLHDCTINFESGLWERYPIFREEPVQNDSVYEARSRLYFEQMDCALLSLRKIFEDMKKAGIFEQSVVVIHGDHGSMISKYFPRSKDSEKLTDIDLRAHFSTLFAVKFPHSQFQVDKRTLPLSALLEGFTKAVSGYLAGNRSDQAFSQAIPNDPDKVAKFVYLMGSTPMQKVESNIFED